MMLSKKAVSPFMIVLTFSFIGALCSQILLSSTNNGLLIWGLIALILLVFITSVIGSTTRRNTDDKFETVVGSLIVYIDIFILISMITIWVVLCVLV